MKIENMGFRDAVGVIRGWCFATSLTSQLNRPTPTPPQPQPPPKNLILPERAGVTLQLFDYLCIKRGIDSTIIHRLMDENKLYQDRRSSPACEERMTVNLFAVTAQGAISGIVSI